MLNGSERILVTGGAGFIGSHLVDRLLESPSANVVAFDNLTRGRIQNLSHQRANPRLEVIQGDVRDASAVRAAARGAKVVYHLAAQPTVMGAVTDDQGTFSTNVVGTFNVLRAATGQGVERLVFTSSRQVYGEPISLPVDEDSPLLAINSYGASKIAGEAYCRAFRREFGLQVTILRVANAYGPRDTGRVIPFWIEQAAAGRELNVFGGNQVVDFVWIEHVVEALVRAAALEGPALPMNIGSGTGTRLCDLARRIARLAYRQPRVRLQPARAMEVTRFVANVDRMRRILGLEPPLDPLMYLSRLIASPAGVSG